MVIPCIGPYHGKHHTFQPSAVNLSALSHHVKEFHEFHFKLLFLTLFCQQRRRRNRSIPASMSTHNHHQFAKMGSATVRLLQTHPIHCVMSHPITLRSMLILLCLIAAKVNVRFRFDRFLKAMVCEGLTLRVNWKTLAKACKMCLFASVR